MKLHQRATNLSRRAWLSYASGLLVTRPLFSQSSDSGLSSPLDDDRISLSSMADVEGNITPVNRFFVRNHHSQPNLLLKSWRLRIEGAVYRPLEFSFSDLIESSTHRLEGLLECAGNRTGLVSNGLWEGIPLASLLKRAKPKEGVTRVLLQGADTGSLLPNTPAFPYSRLLPLEKCLSPEPLVAFKLNDQFLPRRNGFPARAFIPGWYGMDSVKWLTRIILLDSLDWPPAYYSSGMDLLYQRWVKRGIREEVSGRISEIQINSGISFPPPAANLAQGNYKVQGFAWAGPHTVSAVQLSSDLGKTWQSTQMEAKSSPFTWVRWNHRWDAPKGEQTLMVRAQDNTGKWQPRRRDTSRTDGYELNWYPSVECTVL